MYKRFLTKISPADKPWDRHKKENVSVAGIYRSPEGKRLGHSKKGMRMDACSGLLTFGSSVDSETGEVSGFKLVQARFCRVRYCPICQWRRSMLWRARFFNALPGVMAEYPDSRFIFLTLTVENCPIEELRETVKLMNAAWQRLTQREIFSSVQGWVRVTEVTREKKRPGYAHPHFHCLLMVPPSYFKKHYVKQAEWRATWRKCLRADYDPQVDVRCVRARKKSAPADSAASANLPVKPVLETLKYSVKPGDMVADPNWFLELTEQTRHLRFISSGGVFKNVLKESQKPTNEEMITLESDSGELLQLFQIFMWSRADSRYVLVDDGDDDDGYDSS